MSVAPPGWYEAPEGSGTWSYWDGSCWIGAADVRGEAAVATEATPDRAPLDPHDILLNAVDATLGFVDTQQFLRFLEMTVQLNGSALLEQLRPEDRASLLVPVDFVIDGKPRQGSILLLQDRALFAWQVGTFRLQDFLVVVPYSSIERVATDTKPASTFSVALPIVRVSAGREWEIIINNVCLDGARMRLDNLLAGALDGSVTFDFDG